MQKYEWVSEAMLQRLREHADTFNVMVCVVGRDSVQYQVKLVGDEVKIHRLYEAIDECINV
jgi:hypothetical protein